MTGTTIAQAIPIAISPILTRLYEPTDYGVFALFVALVAFLSAAATGRYELAVMLPDTDDDADALVVLSAAIAAGFSAVLFAVVLLWRDWIASRLGHPEIAAWLFLVPMSVFVTGCYNALNYWLNRQKQYRRMSTNRMLQSGLGSVLQLGMGAARLGVTGLIIGHFIGVFVTAGLLAYGFVRSLAKRPVGDLKGRIRHLAARYRSHPYHLLPAQWIGAAALQLPVLAISALFGSATVGFYALASRIVFLPSILIANAMGDVYRQRASVLCRQNGEFRRLFLVTLGTAAVLAAVPAVVLFLIAPDLFALVFGEPWRAAGDYARILVVAAFFQFVFTPVDKGALIVGATRYIMAWHILRLTSFVAAILAGWGFSLSVEKTLMLFVAANVLLYVIDGMVEYRLAGLRKPSH